MFRETHILDLARERQRELRREAEMNRLLRALRAPKARRDIVVSPFGHSALVLHRP
jgi:hypothetical protein